MNMDMLHADLVQEILSRLPVRSLMQCRLVCRLWRDLTSNREFTRIHAAQSLAAIPGIMRNNFVSMNDGLSYQYKEFFFIDRRINAPIPTYFPVQFSIPDVTEFSILDSCNGLVLLVSNTGNFTRYICNPLIRKFIALPDHDYPIADSLFIDLDFGYCPKTKSYKVLETSLWVVDSETSNPKYWMEKYVFKLGDNSWNSIDSNVSIITRRYGLASNINGAFHWIDECWGTSLTVFDLEHDVFDEMPGPVSGGTGRFSTGIIGNCLSVINFRDNILDIWIMKEYWVFWEKYCVINLIDILDYQVLDYQMEGTEFLILHQHEVISYNIEEKVFKTLLTLDGYCNLVSYYDTLLSPLDL